MSRELNERRKRQGKWTDRIGMPVPERFMRISTTEEPRKRERRDWFERIMADDSLDLPKGDSTR